MEKIQTLYLRRNGFVVDVVNPRFRGVLAGWWTARRKYDGVACRLTIDGLWWVRARFDADAVAPAAFEVVSENGHGTRWGWVPVRGGIYSPPHGEALAALEDPQPGTYELVGPGLGDGTHRGQDYELFRHDTAERIEDLTIGKRLSYVLLGDFLLNGLASRGIEGIVWYRPDGRQMVKLKASDFRR